MGDVRELKDVMVNRLPFLLIIELKQIQAFGYHFLETMTRPSL